MRKFVKKTMAWLLILIMAAINVAVVSAASEVQESDFTPIRATFEALGGEVEWNTEARSITATLASNTLVFFADSQNAYANSRAVTLQNNIFIVDGVSYVHPDDFNYVLMRGMDIEVGGHLSGTILEARLLAPLFMAEFSIPGMTVAIVDAQRGFTWMQGFGYACTTQGIPVDEHTVFGIASVSKPFTAIAVMQLVESGMIDLDTPIIEYLPNFSMQPSPGFDSDYRNITTRMLLTHTSGMGAQFYLTSIWDYDYFSLGGHSPEFMNLFLDNLAQYYLEHPEDEVYYYSNNGYVLLGILVAAMTGEDNFFDDFVRYTNEHIFEPAGMTRSSFILTDGLMPYLARPYVDIETPEEYIFPNGLPTGSMVSTGYDMARLMHILLNDDGKLLAPGTVERMMQPHDFDFSDVGMEYGFGFARVTTANGLQLVGHDGQWNHYGASMLFHVDSGLGVFVAINGEFGRAHGVALLTNIMLLENAVMEKSGQR